MQTLRDALAVLEGIRAAAPSQVEVLRLLGRGRTLLGMTLAFDNQLSQGEAELEQAFCDQQGARRAAST